MQVGHPCPRCGQPLPILRYGVRLTPLKARIFDLIARAGPDGICAHELFNMTMRDRGVGRVAMRSHISQINNAMEETAIMIRGQGGRAPRYWIVKRKVRTVA